MKAIQQQIKWRMAEKRLSANELEKQAGLKSSAVGNILYGRSKNPGIETIQNIARALGCSVSELIGEEVSDDVNTQGISQSEVSSVPWDFSLYLDCLESVRTILKAKKTEHTRNNIIDYIDEVYKYSISSKNKKADYHFAKWLIESNLGQG